MRGVEEEIGRLELELAEIEGTLSDPLTYAAKPDKRSQRRWRGNARFAAGLGELEARWLAVSEALQSAERAG